jgi:AcrR family transcriptional regulator
MSELATDLRMSPNTLYQHFRSKKDLVTALVERWAQEVGASQAGVVEAQTSRSAIDGMTRWAEAWAQNVARYSPAFWEDLRRDHAEASAIFRREIRRWKELGAEQLRPHLLPSVHPDVALAVLDLILGRVSDPRFSEELGTTRRESIGTAIGIWARGALKNQGKLSVLPRR